MNFADVRHLVIPEGEAAAITCGGKILWQKQKYKRELLYLESTGTQWINIGTTINTATDEVELVFQNMESTIYKWFFGQHDNNARFGLGSGDGIDKRNVAYGNNTYKVTDDQFYNSQHTFSANANGVFLDGAKIANFASFASSSTLYLFNLNLNSGNYTAATKVWSFKQSRNGALIRDFIPVLDMNDVPCMYDKVSGKLFYNQGTGEFAYGELPSDDARLPVEYQEVEYIESTGTQYIDTGFVPNQDTRVLTEHFYTKQPQNRGFIYGAGVSATDRTFELYTWGNNWNSPYGNTNIVMTPQISMFISGKINIDKNKNNVTITYSDGTSQTKSCEYVTFTAPRNLWLFAINRGNPSVDFRADCVQLCYCKIWDNNILARDFVPCYRKSDGKPGMYDLVTETFFTNAGTGEFIYE